MTNISACLTSKSDEWSTPSSIYKRFLDRGYYDPCLRNHIEDGLSTTWCKKTFVNPPYSNLVAWINKAIIEFENGNCDEIILLVPSRTDTQWFKKLVEYKYSQIQFIEGRLKFNDLKSAPFPIMFVVINRFISNLKFVYLDKEFLKELYQ